MVEQWFSSITNELSTNTVPLIGLRAMLAKVAAKRTKLTYCPRELKLELFTTPKLNQELSNAGLKPVVDRVNTCVDSAVVTATALHVMLAEFRLSLDYELIRAISVLDKDTASQCDLFSGGNASCARFTMLLRDRIHVVPDAREGVLMSCNAEQTIDDTCLYVLGRKDGTGTKRLVLKTGTHFCCSCPHNHENGYDCRHLISLVSHDVLLFDPVSSFAPVFLKKNLTPSPVARIRNSSSSSPAIARAVEDWNWDYRETPTFLDELEASTHLHSSTQSGSGSVAQDAAAVEAAAGMNDDIKKEILQVMKWGFNSPYREIWRSCLDDLKSARATEVSNRHHSTRPTDPGQVGRFVNPLPVAKPGSKKRNRAGDAFG
jgi:hypothetical protein